MSWGDQRNREDSRYEKEREEDEACKIMPLKERTLAEVPEDKVLTSEILHFILKYTGCNLSAYIFKGFMKEKKLKIIMIATEE